MFQRYFTEVESFKIISREFKWYFKSVSRVFQVSFKCDLSKFYRNFKEVSMVSVSREI